MCPLDLRAGQVPAGLAGRPGHLVRDGHPVQRHADHAGRRAARRRADRRRLVPELAADLGRGGSARSPGVRLGADPGPARAGTRPRALAAGPPVDQRPGRDRLLRLLRAPPLQHRRPGLDRGQQVAHRRMLPASQGRGRARPIPGPHLAGLVRPHHLVHARPGLAGRQPGPGRKKGSAPATPA
jgi:hypothetical protein